MKRIIFFLILLIITLIGCGSSSKEKQSDRIKRDEIIFEAIKNKDIDTIQKYYSAYVQEHVELYQELEQLVNYINEIDKYDVIISDISSNTKLKQNTSDMIKDVTDVSGSTFSICIYSSSYRKNYPECEGIYSIQIINNNTLEYVEAGIKEELPE